MGLVVTLPIYYSPFTPYDLPTLDPFTFKLLISVAIIVIATIHGYGAAWLAIWMLFHPYKPLKLCGLTIWPQGMIPRHREKLAESIGNAVGNELVSQQTVFDALFETSFFRRKVDDFVNSYTNDLMGTVYPSFIDALPSQARAPVLDTIAALQYRLAEYIAQMLKSEETADVIANFVERQVDELLERRVGDLIKADSFAEIGNFVEERFQWLVNAEGFENKVREFVSGRVDDLARSNATLAETFTPETIAFIKERIDSQVPPIVHHLADIAGSQNTRRQIGALIKREVDDYYEQLSLIKKIFISRERIHREVDELVNKTLPRRIEEYLRGPAFEQEAEAFLNSTIDNVLARPLNELVGQIESEKFDSIKGQITERILELAKSPELSNSISGYIGDALERLRPQTLANALQHVDPESIERAKQFLTRSLLSLLSRDDTARTINAILSAQIDRLLISPIGRLGDHLSEHSVKRASEALVERITDAAHERLPGAIAEFDVGGLVRRKVSDYPIEKLEALVLSVAQHHLKTIEMFGAVIGFFIGVAQAVYFWMTYVPGR
ncbi:MAG TPA: DUF445 family protein [Pyrinomonadaceae bacterium]|nr:DUF445 family protein [Pyrinomonadaceae bacterium]